MKNLKARCLTNWTVDCSKKRKRKRERERKYWLEGETAAELSEDKEVNGVCHIFINNFVSHSLTLLLQLTQI